MKTDRPESGLEILGAVNRILGYTNTDVFEGYSVEGIIRVVLACRASDWDIVPSDLRREEITWAAVYGSLSSDTLRRLKKTYG